MIVRRTLRLASAIVLSATLSGPALAQTTEAGETPRATAGILGLLPADSQTSHTLRHSSGDIGYTATAGTIDLMGQDGQRKAKIFYTAYVAKPGEDGEPAPPRPLTFAFNGGPGAASAYLHLGLMGPRIVEFGPSGTDGTQPQLGDNPQSWLAFTDLVFIDPVGTGWSRAVSDDAAGNFYGVRQDAESLAKFIALYVQRNDRLMSPKYLAGESYGGYRAAKVAGAMKDSQGMLASGIVMVSPFLEGRFLGNADDPLSASLQLPSLAAAQMERAEDFSPAALAEIERFAMSDYLVTLAGAPPVGAAADAFYARVSEATGIALDAVRQVGGFVGDIYAKTAAGEGRVVSPYDAAHAVADAYPETSYARNDDPVLDGYTRAYQSAFAFYARSELTYPVEMTYTLLNQEVNRRWEWNGGRRGEGRGQASAAGDLRDLLSVIPQLRLMIVHGYSDALTPYGVSRYVIDHLPQGLTRDRVDLHNYQGGHMFYTQATQRAAFSADAARFYADE